MYDVGLGLTGMVLGGVGGFLGERNARRERRRNRQAIAEARAFADETVKKITADPLFANARSFIEASFGDAINTPFAEDAAKSIRAAQAQRGMFAGGIADIQEAVGRSKAAQDLKQSLLPSAMQWSFAPEQFRQSILGFEAPLRQSAAIGPGLGSPISAMMGQAFSGGLAGYQMGVSFDQQNQMLEELRAMRRPTQSRSQLSEGEIEMLRRLFGGG